MISGRFSRCQLMFSIDICEVCVEIASSSAGSLYLRDDPVSGTHLENQSEVRAPTVDMAAHLLDAAIAARTVPGLSSSAFDYQ